MWIVLSYGSVAMIFFAIYLLVILAILGLILYLLGMLLAFLIPATGEMLAFKWTRVPTILLLLIIFTVIPVLIKDATLHSGKKDIKAIKEMDIVSGDEGNRIDDVITYYGDTSTTNKGGFARLKRYYEMPLVFREYLRVKGLKIHVFDEENNTLLRMKEETTPFIDHTTGKEVPAGYTDEYLYLDYTKSNALAPRAMQNIVIDYYIKKYMTESELSKFQEIYGNDVEELEIIEAYYYWHWSGLRRMFKKGGFKTTCTILSTMPDIIDTVEASYENEGEDLSTLKGRIFYRVLGNIVNTAHELKPLTKRNYFYPILIPSVILTYLLLTLLMSGGFGFKSKSKEPQTANNVVIQNGMQVKSYPTTDTYEYGYDVAYEYDPDYDDIKPGMTEPVTIGTSSVTSVPAQTNIPAPANFKFCSNCGTKLAGDANFCMKCGAKSK